MTASVPKAPCSMTSPGGPLNELSRTIAFIRDPAPMLTISKPLAEKPPTPLALV